MPNLYCDMNDKVSTPATPTVTQTCSVASEMTGNDVLVSNFVEQEESSIMESRKKESSVWTNEKHSLYLKSIEASFIDQLYNSLECSSDAISTWKNHANTLTPSGQFKVLQGGCWSKKNFRRENSPHVSPANPWIQHFTNGTRQRPLSSANLRQYHLDNSQLHQESAGSDTEVTGQNFVEDTSIEKKTNRSSSRKRMRTSIDSINSSNDQVVPFCTSPTKK